ncbi:unnamed protein product [Trichobilharzia regenti]|nr:unnamed protein product [Trichobilharzia regenti]
MDHFAMLQSPAYSSTIQSELERERNRQTELLKHIKVLEQSIAKLHTDGAELLNRFTKRVRFCFCLVFVLWRLSFPSSFVG